MAQRCFMQGCEYEVLYICLCLCSETYSCEFHLLAHLKLPNRSHAFDSILSEPPEETKDRILEFLAKEMLKKKKLKKIVLASFKQNLNNSNNWIEESLAKLDFDLNEINSLIENISQASEEKEDSFHGDTDAKRVETNLPNDSDSYARVRRYCRLSHLRHKTSEMLNRVTNDPKTEKDFREICSLYKNHASDSLISQAYQKYISAYQKITSIYTIDNNSNLHIYDPKTEREEVKDLGFSKAFGYANISAQLPNGELFITGWDNNSSAAFIIDRNYQVRKLASLSSYRCMTAIYFNKSIYWFGSHEWIDCSFSHRFDLDENRWIKLAQEHNINRDYINDWNSRIFNKNILISSHNCNLFLYSIEIDSFSEIPYNFNPFKKILISAEERLYLIECLNCLIYESGVGDEYSWTPISKSIIDYNLGQVFCSYCNGEFYISISEQSHREYFKFDLSQKTLVEIAFYSIYFALKRLGKKLEVIECYGQTFRLNPEHAEIYINKKYSLWHIGSHLDLLEYCDKCAKLEPGKYDFYYDKSNSLFNLGRNLEVIEYCNEWIDLKPCIEAYKMKGEALFSLDRNIEAIECCNEWISINPCFDAYKMKGEILSKVGQYLEAIESYNEAINLWSCNASIHIDKGKALYNLDRYLEALECYNEGLDLEPNNADFCFNKGDALYNLNRYLEALECYDEAIKLNPNNSLFFSNRAKAFNKLGRQTEALQDLNKADDLIQKNK